MKIILFPYTLTMCKPRPVIFTQHLHFSNEREGPLSTFPHTLHSANEREGPRPPAYIHRHTLHSPNECEHLRRPARSPIQPRLSKRTRGASSTCPQPPPHPLLTHMNRISFRRSTLSEKERRGM